MKKLLSTIFALSALAPCSYAIDWTGQGDAGYSQSSGNSDNTSLKVGLEFVGKQDKFTHIFGLGSYAASQDNETSAESYQGKYELNYDIADNTYLLSELTHLDDRFSGYDYQSSLVLGAGYTFVDNETRHFSAEAGAGFRRSKLSTSAANSSTETEEILSAATKYKQQLTATTDFLFNAAVKAGEENTYSEAEAVLAVSMTEALSLKLGYLVKNNSDVPANTKKTDTLTSVSISYKF